MDAKTPFGEIGSWLESLGLGRYQQLFIDQEIDSQILPGLTELEFTSMGIPLGPRKKRIRAPQALRTREPEIRSRERDRSTVKPSSPRWPVLERRYLTVLTCD